MLFPMGILIPAHCWIYHKWGYCMGLFKDMVKIVFFFLQTTNKETLYNDSPGENSHHAMPKASLSTWRSSSSQAMTRPVSYALLLPILVGQSWFLSYIYIYGFKIFWRTSTALCMGITFNKCRLGSKTCQTLAEKMLEYETYAHARGTTHQSGSKQSLACVSTYFRQNGSDVPTIPQNWLRCPDRSQGGIYGKSLRARLLESQDQALWARHTQVWKGWDLGPASAKLRNLMGFPTPAYGSGKKDRAPTICLGFSFSLEWKFAAFTNGLWHFNANEIKSLFRNPWKCICDKGGLM